MLLLLVRCILVVLWFWWGCVAGLLRHCQLLLLHCFTGVLVAIDPYMAPNYIYIFQLYIERYMILVYVFVACVLFIKPLFLPVDIQQN